MNSRLLKTCSWFLVLVMLINILPVQALAQDSEEPAIENIESQVLTNTDTATATESYTPEDVSILMELEESRTEFTKEYKLSNGMFMAIVYPEAVHYEEDGQWKDIDNTLQLKGSGDSAAYATTAGSWHAEFPKQLRDGAQVTITKDGFAVSFGMAGELRSSAMSDNATVTYSARSIQGTTQTMTVSGAKESSGQVHTFDYTEEKANAQHPEVIRDKLKSRMSYSGVYNNTDIVYDVNSYQLKESIVINAYDAAVRGYLYTLDTGTLVPVLNDDGSIDLLKPNSTEVVMTMPAPFMIDDAGATSNDVLVTLEQKGDCYLLAYQMPMDWLADEDRAWPVVLDPVVTVAPDYSNIIDNCVTENLVVEYNAGALYSGYHPTYGKARTYLKYLNIPTLTSSDVIVHAYLELLYYSGSSNTTTVEVHKVTSRWDSVGLTWSNKPGYIQTVEDYANVSGSGTYTWTITDIVRDWYTNGYTDWGNKDNTGLMLKATDEIENAGTSNWKSFCSVDYSSNEETDPCLVIIYRNANGLENYWDYTSASAGRAGTGYVNNYTGNLTWVHNDIGFGGNLMPVSISHIYNSNDSSVNTYGLGYGWRTNFNQTVEAVTIDANSALAIDASYVWTDGDGTKHYFIPDDDAANTYYDEDGLELTLTVSNDAFTITDKYGNTSNFDSDGRLISMVNNQTEESTIEITYTGAQQMRISQITDGAGRTYNFTYSNNLLTRISYTGTGTTEIAYISFGYEDSCLTSITNQDTNSCAYKYTDGFLSEAKDIDGYCIRYAYSAAPKRVITISEHHNDTNGSTLNIEYAHNQTTFTDHNNHVQITQFNDWGNVISVQDGEGRAQFAQYARNDYEDTAGKGNQLVLSSKMQNTVVNLLNDSSFENSSTWTVTSSGITQVNNSGDAYLGSRYLKLTQSEDGSGEGVSGPSFTAAAGKTYTFSAYIKTGNLSAHLALTDGTTTVTSDTIAAGTGYTRLEVSYTASAAATVTPQLIVSGSGSLHMDCVQVEQAATASRYNLLQNGDFRTTGYWSSNAGRTTTTSAAPQLSSNVYKITGSPTAAKTISQTVQVSGNKGDTFILAGWAKGDAAPLTDTSRGFGLKLTFNHTDGSESSQSVSFNPDCDSQNSWQYAATPAVATAAYSSVTVEVVYSYNVNTVYFDGIQLFKEEFGSSYTYDDNGNIESVVDLQKQETTYEYDANSNLTKISQDTTAKMTYEYDDHHNVIKATTATGVVYVFEYDEWGNNTSVSITSGDTTITSSAEYTDDHNYLAATTDALGKTTTYSYNANTGILESVHYPGDTAATATQYTYDEMYRLATATATTDTGTALTATYGYTNDLLTSLTTGSTTYTIAYGDFAQTSSITAGSQLLVSYLYTEDKNRYLKELDYGNGDSVQYEYDDYGRLTKETFEDGDTVTYRYDNTGALATVTDSATGVKTTYYYDFTDRLMKYVESDGTNTHSVAYSYDSLNNLTQFTETIGVTQLTTKYTYDADNRVSTVTHTNLSGAYTYDDLGRISTILSKYAGSTVITDAYTYYTNSGRVHKLTMTAANYSAAYTYTYDDKGNILSVSDGTNTTTYVYDSANQLTRENNQAAGKSWTWTYDDAGNILTKSEYAYTTGTLGTATDTITYTYSTGTWGDLMTKYDGVKVTTDGIGNTTRFGATTYQWQHGRELASLSQEATVAIVTQPEDFTGILGDAITFSVKARGNDLTYQWQVSVNGGTSWSSSGATGNKTNAISGFNITEDNDGKLYRCKITGADGTVRYSEPAEIVLVPIVIDSQPQDFFGAVGDEISFSVTARGTDLTYRWQLSWNGGSSWSNSTGAGYATSTIYGFDVTEARVGRLYRCKITDADGNVVYSEPGQIYLDTVTILEQPEDFYGIVGDKAIFTVKAGGSGLTYRWQVSTNGGTSWSNSNAGGYATASMWVKMTGNNPGYLYRCKITDSYGNVVYSEPGEIKVAADVWEFTYNADGLRTSRTNGYTTYEYVYHGSQLSRMTVGSQVLTFGYDASGTPLYVIWNGSKYFYTTNLQGDVVAIVSANGNPVVYYTYDAWGNILSITGTRADNLGKYNPLRYRGYIFDQETHLYYLQSRYYDPQWGRFLNADTFVSTGQGILGNNMFAYCGNNPVDRKDSTGTAYVFLDEFVAEVDPDGPFDEASVGGGGWGLGVNTSYYTSQRVQSYDWNWQNSPYNQNPTGPTGTSECFVAGTLIQTDDGTKPIEEIEAGDCVWAWDEETGDVALKEVVETYINETTELIHIFVDGEEIITTPTHPFYSPVKGWTDAAQLRAGDILVLVDGEYVVVEKVQHELLEAPVTVYNFQVEEYHTYYVSNAGVLVHNDCGSDLRQTPDQRALLKLAEEIARNARGGKFISYQEAQILDEWASEYDVPNGHGAKIGSGVHWVTGWDHTHIYNEHVPFITERN